MGLFDIFKRRSKKKEQAAAQSAEQTEQQSTNAESSETAAETRSGIQSASSQSSESVNSDSATVGSESSSQSTDASAESAEATESSSNASSESASSVEASSKASAESAEATESSSNTSSESASSVEASSKASAESDEATSTSSNASSESASSAEASSEASAESDEATATSSNASSESASSAEASSEASAESDSASANSATEDQPAVPEEAAEESEKYEHGLAKSRSSFGQRLNKLFANFRSVDEDFFDDLEDTLIESDVGFDMAVNLTDQLRDEVKLRNVKSRSEVQNVVVQKLIELYDENGNGEKNTINFAKEGPTVILFVGVNGVGKTTTIGKMAKLYHDQGKKVLLAAADTFRAGAIQQLDVWAKRDEVDIVKKPEKSDPASVVFDAVQRAKKGQYDVLFVDTAGRLQNKVNLMNELSKMKKILTREIPMAPHEVMLVLDATTGQNALNQAKLFKQVTDVTGITLTKLDGTAKGGIVLAIRNELHTPVKYVGLGEKVGDLQPFNASDFVYGLFNGLLK
ncbi:signal recognition particle-docking protein FtsY [Lactobacillus sp. Sy-1]|uniref:signal recognition particle-docking protein FtsY n=1 Tax=Lactobacillus sp. Sy-1 TaxID=2109645 RepID=UPI001C55F57B|nr:signal recognition particle-docking protein FtsY [Lactobacillus sp. Sy-1]MBW1605617.1 signal recognition particle-docking protein FtsY [Lactobacillus sp. Sy-1]